MKRAVYGLALLLPLFVVDTINLYPPGRGIPDNVNVYPPITPTTENTNYYPAFPSTDTGSSLLTDLVAYWNLDELTGTREKTAGNCTSCDLTAVNAPLAVGGAGKYALLNAATQGLTVASNASLAMGDVDYTVAFWSRTTTCSDNLIPLGKDAASNREFYATRAATSGAPSFTAFNSSGTERAAADAGVSICNGASHLVIGWHDATANTVNIQVDARAPVATAMVSAHAAAAAAAFTVGQRAYVGFTAPYVGTIGPVLVWRTRALDADSRTSLYNAGLGYSCANLPAALRTSLSACWDLDEASGTRVASTAAGAACTTDCNLTAINAPGRTAGLVENSLGMSGYSISGSSQALNLDDNASISFGDEDFTTSCWVNPSVLGDKIILDKTNEYRLGVNATNKPYAKTGTTDTATAAAATTAGAWILVSGGFDSAGSKTWVSVNGAARVEANETAAPSDGASALRIFSTSAGGSYWDGAVDACGIWGKNVPDATLLALYAAGAGVEYPWSSVASLFPRPPSPWALRSVEEKQEALYARYGVAVPAFMIPSRRVFVR